MKNKTQFVMVHRYKNLMQKFLVTVLLKQIKKTSLNNFKFWFTVVCLNADYAIIVFYQIVWLIEI